MYNVIDLFAGPGGLGEGFSSFRNSQKQKPFRISVSIEKDKFAYETLLLRAFFRQFVSAPIEYYQYLRGEIPKENLFSTYPNEATNAQSEAQQIELGGEVFSHKFVSKKIKAQLNPKLDTIVIGGPPCQAYSMVGRSKMAQRENFNDDPRHTLYKEYLKIISEFSPAIFVMENVKGMLSSKLDGEYIFDKILEDLKNPTASTSSNIPSKKSEYKIFSLVTGTESQFTKKKDFVIKSENFGIPQARHRVILLGIRNDISIKPKILIPSPQTTVAQAIDDLPPLRSGLSKLADTYENWCREIKEYQSDAKLKPALTRGASYIKGPSKPIVYKGWFHDPKLKGVINHETRSHISSDLHRYNYMAQLAKKIKKSPKLNDLPKDILPNHKNVFEAIRTRSLFNDRFKVQVADKPATTITSHISKDGHYFIHPDPTQTRSFTVREAARIQTFPDNYKFEGPRTSQYQQVGNAVPPLLAHQIAEIVYDLLNSL